MKYTLIFLLSLACCSRIEAQTSFDVNKPAYFIADSFSAVIPVYSKGSIESRVHILELQNEALTRLLNETRGKLDSLRGEMRNWVIFSIKPESGTIKSCDSCYHLITQ